MSSFHPGDRVIDPEGYKGTVILVGTPFMFVGDERTYARVKRDVPEPSGHHVILSIRVDKLVLIHDEVE